MLTGESPFLGADKQETFLNISQVNIDYSLETFEGISSQAVDFIKSLLVKNPRWDFFSFFFKKTLMIKMIRGYGLKGEVSTSITLSWLTHQGCESGSQQRENTRPYTSKWVFVVARFASLRQEVISLFANLGCELCSYCRLLVQYLWFSVRWSQLSKETVFWATQLTPLI